jgi:hypothetical protein
MYFFIYVNSVKKLYVIVIESPIERNIILCPLNKYSVMVDCLRKTTKIQPHKSAIYRVSINDCLGKPAWKKYYCVVFLKSMSNFNSLTG